MLPLQKKIEKDPLRTRFEPARQYPNIFRALRLNHSAITADGGEWVL